MKEEEAIANIMTKLLDIANTYLKSYCEIYDDYALSDEGLEQLNDEVEKKIAIDLKEKKDFLKNADEFIKEYKKEKNIDVQTEEEEEESI